MNIRHTCLLSFYAALLQSAIITLRYAIAITLPIPATLLITIRCYVVAALILLLRHMYYASHYAAIDIYAADADVFAEFCFRYELPLYDGAPPLLFFAAFCLSPLRAPCAAERHLMPSLAFTPAPPLFTMIRVISAAADVIIAWHSADVISR